MSNENSLPDVGVALHGEAEALYAGIADSPIVSPHGHCDPTWFAGNAAFSDPASLLIVPDHYVFRMLYSQGLALADLGIGQPAEQRDPRAIFRLFASHWHLFLGTPSHLWLAHTFHHVFGISERLCADNADAVYDTIDAALATDACRPRALFDHFGIEVLATTDGALDDLAAHQQIADSDWGGRIVPTFRPDAVMDPATPDFVANVEALGRLTDCDTGSFKGYRNALRQRRLFFRQMGATATDHAVLQLQTQWLDEASISSVYARILAGQASEYDRAQFYGHMLIEMAQMSVEDGLVMQLHVGSQRSTHRRLFDNLGADMGADIPVRVDWVNGLHELLNRVGHEPALTLILFTLDESGYARELAPMAGHWPALRLGPPWWFHDSLNGIARYLDQVVETAGYWNLAGFNDDTRAFPSIPARHDLWRRAVSLHLAQQMRRGLMGRADAERLAGELSRDLALNTYRLKD